MSLGKWVNIKEKKKAKVIFFTSQQVNPDLSHYCLCTIKNYSKSFADKYKEVYVDPGVSDLKKYGDYRGKDKMIKLIESGSLRDNEWCSLDYSIGDAEDNETRKKFLRWTYENNVRWADDPHYMCCIQYGSSFGSFKKSFEKVKHIFWDNKDKMIAIGGDIIGSHYSTSETRSLFYYLRKHADHLNRIHFFGLPIRLIDDLKLLLPKSHLIITVDSTKWRFANSQELLKLNNGLRITTAEHINTFYTSYMKQWQERLGKTFFH